LLIDLIYNKKVTNKSNHAHISEGDYATIMDNNKTDFDEKEPENIESSQSLTIHDAVVMYLRNQFGEAFSKENSENEIVIKVDNSYAEININTMVIIT
jgi:hypothetical protein